MDLSLIGAGIRLLVTNGADINVIEQATGGLSGAVALGAHINNLWKLYESGGLDAVLQKGGQDVQAIIEKIGPANIAAVMPAAGNLLAAYQASQSKVPIRDVPKPTGTQGAK